MLIFKIRLHGMSVSYVFRVLKEHKLCIMYNTYIIEPIYGNILTPKCYFFGFAILQIFLKDILT